MKRMLAPALLLASLLPTAALADGAQQPINSFSQLPERLQRSLAWQIDQNFARSIKGKQNTVVLVEEIGNGLGIVYDDRNLSFSDLFRAENTIGTLVRALDYGGFNLNGDLITRAYAFSDWQEIKQSVGQLTKLDNAAQAVIGSWRALNEWQSPINYANQDGGFNGAYQRLIGERPHWTQLMQELKDHTAALGTFFNSEGGRDSLDLGSGEPSHIKFYIDALLPDGSCSLEFNIWTYEAHDLSESELPRTTRFEYQGVPIIALFDFPCD